MTDKEKLIKIKSLADKMSDAAFNMTTDASLLRKAMDEYHQFIINEYHKEEQIIKELQGEPVSEELEIAANEWDAKASFTPFYMTLDDKGNPNGVKQDYTTHAESFKAGAKWQKEQFEKNRLKHCNSITNEQAELEQGFIDQHLDKHQRMPTFLDAIEYGMRLKEKQIMENATEATVAVDAGGYPYIPQLELYDYDKDVPLAKEGDKYKVILIKEN